MPRQSWLWCGLMRLPEGFQLVERILGEQDPAAGVSFRIEELLGNEVVPLEPGQARPDRSPEAICSIPSDPDMA
ncbi:hypothetical protein C5F48_17955 [Cereibacter changlensis JA139]|uniref:Uncharacterized protein n=1 Tax=Cereibacter changlensis JA139 TaxID=1188249 RepID=A0A2T4JR28_9RHOB|nr:hypothetical protein C5F48_17955 [Cereibacter changlensis JA139]